MKRCFRISLVLLFMAVLVSPSLFAQWVGATVNDYRGLVGTWQVRVYSETFPEFISLVTVNADGTWYWVLPTVDMLGGEDSRVVCVGPWKWTGPRKYHMTLYCLGTQAPDSPSGRYMFDVTVSKDGLTFTDPAFLAEWWMGPLDESELVFNEYLTVEGKRLPNVPKP